MPLSVHSGPAWCAVDYGVKAADTEEGQLEEAILKLGVLFGREILKHVPGCVTRKALQYNAMDGKIRHLPSLPPYWNLNFSFFVIFVISTNE